MFYDRPSRFALFNGARHRVQAVQRLDPRIGVAASGHGGGLTRRVLLSGVASVIGGSGVAGLAGGTALLGCGHGAAQGPVEPRISAKQSEDEARIRAGNDDLFRHLADQSKTVPPISADERSVRRKKLQGILGSLGAGALILEGGATLTYLTGVSWWKSERLFALVVPAEGAHFWICPAFEEGRARSIIDAPDGPGGAIVTWQEHAYPYAVLDAALRERRIEKLLIEPQLRWGFVERLSEIFGRERIASGQAAVVLLRARKDAHEVQLLRRASELTQLAIVETAKTLTAGLTGAEIGARVDRAHEKLGMRNAWNVCLIGAAAAEPHGKKREARLSRGDVLLMDVGASLHGYQSDTTRTFVFDGAPSIEVERAWNTVRAAQMRAFEVARAGTACCTVDRSARALIANAGFGIGYATFTHRLGHGIGLETHEDPYFDSGNVTELEPGMTLTDEPGLYFPGQFGVRIEDVLLVTSGEAEHFGTWQASVRAPG